MKEGFFRNQKSFHHEATHKHWWACESSECAWARPAPCLGSGLFSKLHGSHRGWWCAEEVGIDHSPKKPCATGWLVPNMPQRGCNGKLCCRNNSLHDGNLKRASPACVPSLGMQAEEKEKGRPLPSRFSAGFGHTRFCRAGLFFNYLKAPSVIVIL